jgi:hypothetical protein
MLGNGAEILDAWRFVFHLESSAFNW